MRNKWYDRIKVFCICVIIIAISFAVSFLITNYRVLRCDNQGITNIDIDEFEITNEDDYTSYYYEFDETTYVNKILFNLDIDSNVSWTLDITYENIYGVVSEETLSGIANSVIDVFSEKLSMNISSFTLKFNKEDINISNFQIKNEIVYASNLTLWLCVLGVVIFLIIHYRKYLKDHLEIAFVIIALGVGGISIMCYPTLTGLSWDDQIHFYTAYGLFHDYYTESAYFLSDPDYIVDYAIGFNTIEENLAIDEYLNSVNDNILPYYSHKDLKYSNIVYVPMAVGLKLGDVLSLNFTTTIKLAKVINLLFYVCLVYFAIRKIPRFKYLLMCIGLIPTTLLMATNFSYDPPVTGAILLGFAYFIYEYINKDKKVSSGSIAIMLISFLFASFTKIVYAPLILLPFLLPKDKFKNNKVKWISKTFVVVCTILMIGTYVVPVSTTEVIGDTRGGDVGVTRQIDSIISSPISFINMFIDNVSTELLPEIFSKDTLINYKYLESSDNNFDENVYYILLILLLLAVYIDNNEEEKGCNISNIEVKLPLLFITIGIYCIIWLAMYLSFTPVGDVIINGVQNRYFIPLILPVCLLLYSSKIRINLEENNKYLIYNLILSAICFITVLDNLVYLMV